MSLWARTKQLPNIVVEKLKDQTEFNNEVSRLDCMFVGAAAIVFFFISRAYRRLARVLSLVLLMYTLENTLPYVYHAIECCNFVDKRFFLSNGSDTQKESPLNPAYFLGMLGTNNWMQ